MNNPFLKIHKYLYRAAFLLMLTLILFFSSCTSYKDLIYMKELARGQDTTVTREPLQYKLRRGDILYVKVITNNDEIDKLFNLDNFSSNRGQGLGLQNQAMMNGDYLYLQGYSVDDSGYIDLPVIHKVPALNRTVDETKASIEKKLKEILEDAIVIVKLQNFNITFLGEFEQPGVQQIMKNRLTVMEALGYAGGISRNGNRKDVMVIRQLDGGSQVYRLDLTDKKIIASQDFELLPNDIIYAAPRRVSWFKDETATFTFWLTTISTTMTTIALIISLSK